MIQTKIFKINKSPAGTSWDDWFDTDGVTPDFMAERSQPEQQKRESFDD